MLTYNLQPLFSQRAIKNKVAYLIKAGFNKQTAARIIRNKFSALKLSQIERLCLALHCTPNDIIEYTPDPQKPIPNHPLTKLIRTKTPIQLTNIVDDIPFDKLNDFTDQLIQLKTQILNT